MELMAIAPATTAAEDIGAGDGFRSPDIVTRHPMPSAQHLITVTKYVIIAAILALAFIFVYSRIRPYLKLIHKVVNSLNVSTSVGASTATPRKRSGENKLVRCASCGTWIPEDRALNLRSGQVVYCSPECLEKKSEQKERKLAG